MENITDSTEYKDDKKKALSETLVNDDKPEMITFVREIEVDDIALLQTIGSDIDNQRETLNIPGKSFLSTFIKNNLVIRTSINGERSKQLVNTINAVSNEELVGVPGMSLQGKRMLGV